MGRRALAALAGAVLALQPAPCEPLQILAPSDASLPHLSASFGPRYPGEAGVGGPLREPPLAHQLDIYLCDASPFATAGGALQPYFRDSVALVARGQCRFVDKVLLAQRLGARGVVVYSDDEVLPPDQLVLMSVDTNEGELARIPSVFVSYNSYSVLDELMDKSPNGTVEVIINGTNAVDTDVYDASPLFVRSIVFMLQLLLMLWTVIAFVFLINLCKARHARGKRLAIVQKLPTRIFRAGVLTADDSADGDGSAGASAGATGAARPPDDVSLGPDTPGSPPSGFSDARHTRRSGRVCAGDSSDSDADDAAAGAGAAVPLPTRGKRHPRHRDMHRLPSAEAEIELQSLPLTVAAAAATASPRAVPPGSPSSVGSAGSDISIRVDDEHEPRTAAGAAAAVATTTSSGAAAAAAAAAATGAAPAYYQCDSCVICMCDFEDGERVTVLPCGHNFHKGCIEPWLIQKSALCPICKKSILPTGDARSLEEISQEADGAAGSQQAQAQGRFFIIVGAIIAVTAASSLLYILKQDK